MAGRKGRRKAKLAFALFYGAWEVEDIVSGENGGRFDYPAHLGC